MSIETREKWRGGLDGSDRTARNEIKQRLRRAARDGRPLAWVARELGPEARKDTRDLIRRAVRELTPELTRSQREAVREWFKTAPRRAGGSPERRWWNPDLASRVHPAHLPLPEGFLRFQDGERYAWEPADTVTQWLARMALPPEVEDD